MTGMVNSLKSFHIMMIQKEDSNMMQDYYWFVGGWGFIMMLIPLLFIGLIIYGVYQLGIIKKSDEPTGKAPEDILAERFARSEISKEEYIEMKETLKKS